MWLMFQAVLQPCTSHGMTDKALLECFYKGLGPENRSVAEQLCEGGMLYQHYEVVAELINGPTTRAMGLGEMRKEEKGKEKARFIKIVEFRLWISSKDDPYEVCINDSKKLGKEPMKFRGFRDEKWRRKAVKHLGKGVGRLASQRTPKEALKFSPRGSVPASAPQTSF
uniref:Uncharacterized protein n=1 Tax=Solanum tuberosum TaxID=4113 RepID=M1D9M9_SOLTU